MDHHYRQSSFREKTLEHIFIGECLKALWKRGIYDTEILRSEVDGAGYDIVFQLRHVIRHVQLKTSHTSAKASRQNLSGKLTQKPSACVVWIVFDADTLALGPFYWFGNAPGERIDELPVKFPRAKHTKGNSQGVKLERQNTYSVPKNAFRKLATIDELVTKLFGELPTS